jgi:hypothetical protein
VLQEALSQQDDLRYDNVRILRELEVMREEVAALREGHGASVLQAVAEAETQAAQAQSDALQQVYLSASALHSKHVSANTLVVYSWLCWQVHSSVSQLHHECAGNTGVRGVHAQARGCSR